MDAYTTPTASTSLSHRSSMSSKFELNQDLLESARVRLLEPPEQETQIILAENVSPEDYLKVYLENEQKLPVKIRLVDKRVIAYEVALTPHGAVVCHIGSLCWTE